MNFDRNTIVGFLVLALLFIGYFWWNSKEQTAYQKQKAIETAKQDSIAAIRAKERPVVSEQDSLHRDTLIKLKEAGSFQKTALDPEKLLVVSNELLTITFTSKGGQPKKVELRKFNGPDSTPVKLASTDFDKIDYPINAGTGAAYISTLNFSDTVTKNPDGSQIISCTLSSENGQKIKHIYTLRPDDYMIDFTLQMDGADKLLTQGNLNLIWQYKAVQQESDISFEKQNTQVG